MIARAPKWPSRTVDQIVLVLEKLRKDGHLRSRAIFVADDERNYFAMISVERGSFGLTAELPKDDALAEPHRPKRYQQIKLRKLGWKDRRRVWKHATTQAELHGVAQAVLEALHEGFDVPMRAKLTIEIQSDGAAR